MRNGSPSPAPSRRGFTIVELMVVVTIMTLLLTLAIPQYNKTILAAKESVLKSNLFTLRTQIQNYVTDKQRAPQSLDMLVTEGYLFELPMDPIARIRNWRTIPEDPMLAMNQMEPGIFNVRSTAPGHGLDGSAYAEW